MEQQINNAALRQRLLAGLGAGVLAGLFCVIALASPQASGWIAIAWTLATMMGVGVCFGAWFGPHVQTAGAGLAWGQVLGVVWWLLGPLTLLPLLRGEPLRWTAQAADSYFTGLLTQWVVAGALLGLLYFALVQWLRRRHRSAVLEATAPDKRRQPIGQAVVPPLVQMLLIGLFSGLLGSWVFAWGIDRAAFYPLVAQLVGFESMTVGRLLHYTIGAVIGLTFCLLFQRDVHQPGVGLLWGMNYGLLWWVVGPLTLMPWLLGIWQRADWSLATAQRFVPSLVSHLLYGALVGFLCGMAGKAWRVFFVASDPIQRTAEGAGVRGVRNILMGIAGGVSGGLLFTIVMVSTGALPAIGRLIGVSSGPAGFIVHLVISMIIGISFGLLFHSRIDTYGAGLAWGVNYGLLWWVLGTLTLYPILLRQPPDWSLFVIAGAYPSLIGHLFYGVGLGLFFSYLKQRYTILPPATLSTRQRLTQAPDQVSAVGAALWSVTLILGLLLVLLLSANGGVAPAGY